MRSLYQDGTDEADQAMSPLKNTGPGESGLVVSPSWAARGSSITIEYTVSNLGITSG